MNTPKKYKVRSGTIDSGKDYEIKMAALLSLICCLENLEHFWIAMNVDECGALDDIVLYIETPQDGGITYLIQLKHQDAAKRIMEVQLLAATGNYSLVKYFDSCTKLKKMMGDVTKKTAIIEHLRLTEKTVFVIFTNKGVVTNIDFMFPINQVPYLDVININGSIYGLDYQKLPFASAENGKEFLDNTFLFTDQPSIKDMDEAIKTAITKLIKVKLSEKDLTEIAQKFVFFVAEWSKGLLYGHYPLTQSHILKKLTELLLVPYMVELRELEDTRAIKDQNFIAWSDFTDDKDVTVVNRADEITEGFLKDFLYTASKKSVTVVNREMLRVVSAVNQAPLSDVYEYLWKTRQVPLLLQVCNARDILVVREILKLSQGVFQVTILNKSEIPLTNINCSKFFSDISDLSEDHRGKVLELPIKLQERHLTSLESLTIQEEHFKYITVRDIIYILSGNYNIGNAYEPLPGVFVEMSLKRVWVTPEVLEGVEEDVFVIQCGSLSDFQAFLQKDLVNINHSEVGEWKSVHEDNLEGVRIIIFDDPNNLSEIEKYCKINFKEFHVLVFHGVSNFESVKSSDTTKQLRGFRKSSASAEVRPIPAKEALKTFCKERKSVLVSANPGMGKSVFANYFAHNAPNNLWTLKISLAKYKKHYKLWEKLFDQSECEANFKLLLVEVLADQKNEQLSEVVFWKYFDLKNVVLLLDGFDEVPVTYQSGAKNFIKFLHDSGYFIFLTTRPVLKNELETLLDTFALTLNLFSREDQEYFLKNYFAEPAKVLPSDERIISYVDELLKALKRNLNDRDNEFTGVPLQTALLAEVFTDDCRKYLETKIFQNKYFDLLYLYRTFIEKKIKIACEKFGEVTEDMICQYKICRAFYALKLLFSENDLKELGLDVKLEQGRLLLPYLVQLMQKDGIVVAEDETNVSFVHQTFGEFIVAEWLSENINGEYREIAKTLIKVTFAPHLTVVRNIFDRILANTCPLHLAIINHQVDKVKEMLASPNTCAFDKKDEGSRIFLHLLASWGTHHPREISNEQICALRKNAAEDDMVTILNLIPSDKLRSTKDSLLNYTPLDYSIASSCLNVAEALCAKLKNQRIFIDIDETFLLQYCDEINYLTLSRLVINRMSVDFNQNTQVSYKRNSLHQAVRNGNVKSVQSLLALGTTDIDEKDETTESSALHVAANFGHTEIVGLLLSNNAKTDLTDASGKTPLHWAVLQGHLAVVSVLIDHGVAINAIDNQERTALHYAVIAAPNKQSEILSALFKNEELDLEMKDINDMTAMMWAANYGYTDCVSVLLARGSKIDEINAEEMSALHWAASNGHTDILTLLLSKGANVEATTFRGTTPLIFAAQHGHEETVRLLLSQQVNLEPVSKPHMTALFWAVRNGHKSIVELLLSKGAKMKTNDTNALCLAAQYGHKDIVELFLGKDADIEWECREHRTALQWAACRGQKEIVKLLFQKGAKLEGTVKTTHTALDLAAMNGHKEIVSFLLSKGALIESKNNSRRGTALHYAAEYGRIDVVNLLIYKGAAVEVKNYVDLTPLHCAAQNGHKNVISILLFKGANLEAVNIKNETALILAARNGRTSTVDLLLSEGANIEARTKKNKTAFILAAKHNRKEVVELLLSKQASIEAKDEEGRTALHWVIAVERHNIEVLNLLFSNNVDIDAKTNNNETALILAARKGDTHRVNLLLSKGAVIEARDNQDMTALHWAAHEGHAETVCELLLKNADMEAKTNDGRTALMLASQYGHEETVDMLLYAGANYSVKDREGLTAFDWAKNHDHKDVVSLLLSNRTYFEEFRVPILSAAAVLVLLISYLLANYVIL